MRFLTMIALFILIPHIAISATINVPGDYTTIQGAISAAKAGDTVLVYPGTYVENIDFLGKAITVKSSNGPDYTTIDGGNPTNTEYGSVVTFDSKEKAGSILEGFTITNGTGTEFQYFIRKGGGIYCGKYASPTILNNIIKNNSASAGGGLFFEDYSYSLVMGNVITDNFAKGSGGGIEYTFSDVVLCNNIIKANTANFGGGLSTAVSGCMIKNNIVYENLAYYKGGGIYCSTSWFPILTDTIVRNNSAPVDPQIHDGSIPELLIVQYSNIEGGWTGTGNIDADPMFADPVNGDFHLLQDPCQPGVTNPCVNRGDPGSWALKGTTRTDSVQDSGVIDIGYHYPTNEVAFFETDVCTFKASTADVVHFKLKSAPEYAQHTYWIFGSCHPLKGTYYGTPLPGNVATLPITFDTFTGLVLTSLNTPVFSNFLGTVDLTGQSSAKLQSLGSLPPQAVGLVMYYAYTLDVPPKWSFASNFVFVEIIP